MHGYGTYHVLTCRVFNRLSDERGRVYERQSELVLIDPPVPAASLTLPVRAYGRTFRALEVQPGTLLEGLF